MEFGRLIYRMHERRADSVCLLKPMNAGIRSVHDFGNRERLYSRRSTQSNARSLLMSAIERLARATNSSGRTD